MNIKFIIFFLFLSYTSYAQQGIKFNYTSSKPVTEETLTKGCQIFDTFVETGANIYYKQRTKKDGSTEDYYFVIVEKQRKDGSKYLTRKRYYVVK